MNKSTLAAVLKRAEEARILLSGKSTQPRGLELFDLLVRDYPRDGMIYFKRAEACEALDSSRKAASDYREAERRFPKPLWRHLARSRAERLEKEIEAADLKGTVGKALGQASDTSELRHIAESAWLAGRFAKENAFVSLELSRTALVRAILTLEKGRHAQPTADMRPESGPSSWYQRLDRVGKSLTHNIANRVKDVLNQRNKAVYEGKPVSPTQAQVAFDTLLQFLRAAFGDGDV